MESKPKAQVGFEALCRTFRVNNKPRTQQRERKNEFCRLELAADGVWEGHCRCEPNVNRELLLRHSLEGIIDPYIGEWDESHCPNHNIEVTILKRTETEVTWKIRAQKKQEEELSKSNKKRTRRVAAKRLRLKKENRPYLLYKCEPFGETTVIRFVIGNTHRGSYHYELPQTGSAVFALRYSIRLLSNIYF